MREINRLTTIWMMMAIAGIQIISRLPPIVPNLAEDTAWRAIKPWGVG